MEQYRAQVQAGESAGWDKFDDLVFKLSAGALALSVTLLGVLNGRSLQGLHLVFYTWVCLAACLLFLLFSVAVSAVAHRYEIRLLDEGQGQGGFGTFLNWLVYIFNAASALLCLLGLSLLLLFAWSNVGNDDKTKPVSCPCSLSRDERPTAPARRGAPGSPAAPNATAPSAPAEEVK